MYFYSKFKFLSKEFQNLSNKLEIGFICMSCLYYCRIISIPSKIKYFLKNCPLSVYYSIIYWLNCQNSWELAAPIAFHLFVQDFDKRKLSCYLLDIFLVLRICILWRDINKFLSQEHFLQQQHLYYYQYYVTY